MRFGVIGCGWAGAVRAEAIRSIPGARLVGMADADIPRAQSVCAQFNTKAFPDWKSLVESDDVDAVIVSTPPALHVEMCVSALDAGKHVLCEKPLARNVEECAVIVKAARRTGRVLRTGFNYRFYPAIDQAKRILDSGMIGELDHIRSYAGHPGGSEFTHNWVHDPEAMGGGTLMDNGIHIVDLTQYLLGDVSEVKGIATNNVWGFKGCEDNGFALLRNRQGKVAVLQASWSEWRGYRFHIEVFGTRGCVRDSYPPMMTAAVWTEESGGRTRKRRYLFPKFQITERVKSPRWTAVRSFVQELTAFTGAVDGRATPGATGADGMRAVQIAHAVYQNAGGVRIDNIK